MRDYEKTVEDLRLNEKLFNESDAVNVATLYRDAANAIEELLTAAPHWISVEERLPEIDTSVLMCAFGKSVGEGTYRGYDGVHHVWKMYAVSGTY